MGGGENTGETSIKVICQMCDQKGHIGADCPWVYSRCYIPNCNVLMLLFTSQVNATNGKKYLKCQHESCKGWQWLQDAAAKSKPSQHENIKPSSSNASSSSCNGCFKCGENDHWVSSCPWKDTTCPIGCKGTRKLWTSRQEMSYGKKILKCLTCGNFEWLSDAIAKVKENRNLNIRVKVEVNLDNLCKGFQNKFNV